MTYYSTERDKPANELLSAPLEPIDPTTISILESTRIDEARIFEATMREAEESNIQLFESVIAECSQATHALDDAEQ